MKMKKEVYDGLIAHAKEEAPIEACGYLAGDGEVVTVFYKLTNIDKSPEHFSFDPKEQFDTVRAVRNTGLTIMGNYHSHPETPARPSEEDKKLAYDPEISYVIVSLAEGEDIKSFKIRDSEVTKEELEVVNV